MSVTYENSQGLVYSLGMLAFICSFVLIGLAHALGAGVVSLNWNYFFAAVLQTVGGTVAVITADVSVNEYFRHHHDRWWPISYAVLWTVAMVLECTGDPQPLSLIYIIAGIPFLYLLLRADSVLSMAPGEYTFCELTTATLALWFTANGIWFIFFGKDPQW
jgi:hypothetical protein